MTDSEDLHYLEISELSRLLAARKVSSLEVTEQLLRRTSGCTPNAPPDRRAAAALLAGR
ncbi:MAG: hypothetical protein ACHP83_09480 [Burkholderiales bacterium]